MKFLLKRLAIAKKTLGILLILAFILLLVNTAYLFHQAPWLLDFRSIETMKLADDRIISKTDGGTIIANMEQFKIDYITIKEIPDEIVEVFLAVEDTRFYEHKGIDIWGIMRASWSIVSEKQLQGGSTITQQLARNIFLSHERTFKRKLDEFIIAIQLERQYTKDEILEMYFNQIHFGKHYYGISKAAEGYFGKNIDQLTLGEIAIIAGLPKGPNLYYPHTENIERSLNRQQVVLNRLLAIQLITQEEAGEACIYLENFLSGQGGTQ